MDGDPVIDEVKHELRAELLADRRRRSPAVLAAARTAVGEAVLERQRAEGWSCVAAYLPLRTEPGSVQLLESLAERGVRVLVPITREDRDLDWSAWPDSAPLGLGAVNAADAVLVPALAVDAAGVRLGRGGGSYDRALRRVRPGVPVAALLFDGEPVERLPAQPWDVPVSAVVTPAGWRSLP